MVKLIVFHKWVYVLKQIDNKKSISDISKKINLTYSHCSIIMSELSSLSLIEVYKSGRKQIAKLTDEGEEIKKRLIYIMNRT